MIDKAPSRVAAMFDGIAARYDLLNRVLSAGFDRGWRSRAVRALGLTGGDCLLDVCTGTADVALEAARRGRAVRVLGVDFSAEMLKIGVRKTRRAGVARRVALVRGDATRLPLAGGTADAATVAFGIRNVAEPEKALTEMYRVLRAGGRLAILEFSIPGSAVVRALYLPYFRHVLPRVGRFVSRHGSAYSYLPASVGAFVPPERMVGLLAACGFEHVRARPLTFGIVTLYTGDKAPKVGASESARDVPPA